MDGWIEITDQLPAIGARVLVECSDGSIDFAHLENNGKSKYRPSGFYLTDVETAIYLRDVERWQPVPMGKHGKLASKLN